MSVGQLGCERIESLQFYRHTTIGLAVPRIRRWLDTDNSSGHQQSDLAAGSAASYPQVPSGLSAIRKLATNTAVEEIWPDYGLEADCRPETQHCDLVQCPILSNSFCCRRRSRLCCADEPLRPRQEAPRGLTPGAPTSLFAPTDGLLYTQACQRLRPILSHIFFRRRDEPTTWPTPVPGPLRRRTARRLAGSAAIGARINH